MIDGHPYCVGTALLQAIERHCVPTDDESSMSVMSKFETLIKTFPGIPSASDFEHLEKWANNTAEQWNRLSPYDENLLNARPRFLQMLAHELKKRKMAKIDNIDWGEFKAYLNKNEQWLAKQDIPVYLSSLIAFSSAQLEALADAEGMPGSASSSKRTATAAFADPHASNSNRRQRLAQWGAQVAASVNGDSANPQGPQGPPAPCPYCGRHHSLDQCRGVQNLIAQHRSRQLVGRGGISKGAVVQLGAMDITAGAARSLGARTVSASPLTLLLALILTTSLCPSRGTMLLCVKLSKPTARPPTLSELQSPLPRARSLWSLLRPSAASS